MSLICFSILSIGYYKQCCCQHLFTSLCVNVYFQFFGYIPRSGIPGSFQFNSVQISCIRLFVTPWTSAHQASLSFTISRSLLKLMPIESVVPSNHLILCRPLLLPSVFLRIRVFSNTTLESSPKPQFKTSVL